MRAKVTLIEERVFTYHEVPGTFTKEEIFNPSPETFEKHSKAEQRERRSWYHEARTANDILIVFSLPNRGPISVGDELEIDLENVDCEQDIPNQTTGKTVRIQINGNNIHDLHLPMRHGGSRFPSPDRRAGN